jgi:chaperone BCS1
MKLDMLMEVGIPYKRGYLFSGPPGTGKTSLTAALAGVFALDIYVLSILDPFLTEEILVRLFSSVPSRCIVLLEDIDAAGLKRADEIKFKKLKGEEVPEEPQTSGVRKKSSLSISLSGLLNAIDGVASSEGRILVMTTNKPKELDQALIRPGRIDLHIPFTLPQRAELSEMFLSMYRGLEKIVEQPEPLFSFEQKKPSSSASSENDSLNAIQPESIEKGQMSIQKEELEELAEKFADELPENQFSLAAIQGYLLRYKHDPRTAVAKVKSWSEETLKSLEELQK